VCGISGIYRFDGRPVERATVERMLGATRHRGPDDEGVLVSGPVGLAHNRLSILDLSANAHQPMHDPLGDNWIVFNGEVYNFQELREALKARGCQFRSSGDTEVILQAYREWGPDCVERFNGMFALAIFEARSGRLFLARDRIGIKPLYYYADDRQLAFASETKAVVLADGVERRIDREAIPELVAFRYLTGGRTLFQGIRELEPGHSLTVSADGVVPRRYWDIPTGEEAGERSPEEWQQGLVEELERSVSYRLIADVPVGCALSGGVDSSLVTSLACGAATSEMHSFSIGFDLPEFDERPYAKQIAGALGIENHTQVLDSSAFFDLLPKLTWHMDEPINHPNSVGIWILAKLARERVTVLLSGEGGDELMGGYPRFRNLARLRGLQSALPGVRQLAGIASPMLPGRAGRIARELARDPDGMAIWASAYMPAFALEKLCGPDAAQRAERARRQILERAPKKDPVARQIHLELKTYLVSLLMRIDKMCMSHSLENRVPLLDHRLVEYASAMPSGAKLTRKRGKDPLFRIVEERFGAKMFQRPKMGFGLPVPYFHGSGARFLRDLVESQSFRERGLVDPDGVKAVVALHDRGDELPADALWILATTELWARTFIDAPGVVAG
jgi:asparagine synthase (glutamine-hydrolysing)